MIAWRNQRILVLALTAALAVGGVIALARASAIGARLVALGSHGGQRWSRAADADELVRAADVASGLVLVVIAPLFLAWLGRAAKNQQALGRRPERLGSGWAIGGWFVPVANLAIPVLVVQDLWRGADAAIDPDDPRWRVADRSWLVGWWWGLLLVGLLGVAGVRADQPDERISSLEQANALALLGSLGTAVAAILAILVVRRLGARQEECRRAQTIAPSVAR